MIARIRACVVEPTQGFGLGTSSLGASPNPGWPAELNVGERVTCEFVGHAHSSRLDDLQDLVGTEPLDMRSFAPDFVFPEGVVAESCEEGPC